MLTKEQLNTLVATMRFETSEIRKSDELDFKEVAIWEVTKALQMAFEMGQKSAKKPSKKSAK